ncbi:hypothetical protein [Micromonospora sp. WMMD712]|uniref:hypothetical protein n=1 Tax=Micromonospora sp. WMMD712 TaxID=3016096 RepID=UPI00249B8AE9|nr:hypothetical protein [Micromonospora sp. WMMD712]WFE59689.1 hypothetical protein O7633_23790 [Micromonospora sp. WMMD712]
MTGPRILISGNFHWQAGFSHTVEGYVRAAGAAGCEVRVSGPLSRMDDQVPGLLPVEPDLGWGTHLVVMFEARQFLTPEQIELATRTFPRSRRLVVDFDLHWADEHPELGVDGTAGKYTAESWRSLYSELSDVMLQPKLTGKMAPGAEFFSCIGMPETVCHPLTLGRQRDYDLQYIGSNWWRWEPLTALVEAAVTLRPVPRMRVCGRFWDGATSPGFEDATTSVPGWLAERGVELCPPVAFGQVIPEMGRSLISPVLVRPLVAGTGLLTPRMFETLASGALPALSADAEFLAEVYGDECAPLLLGDDPATTLARLTTDFERHARIVGRIQDRVREVYGYPRVLRNLLAFFG